VGSRPDEVGFFNLGEIYVILPAALGPGVHSATNRNVHRKHKIIIKLIKSNRKIEIGDSTLVILQTVGKYHC
jgi:hypothetical protein